METFKGIRTAMNFYCCDHRTRNIFQNSQTCTPKRMCVTIVNKMIQKIEKRLDIKKTSNKNSYILKMSK